MIHAVRLHAFGPAENLRYEEVDDPSPGAGQVRITVAAAGVHLIDAAIRSGRQMGPLPLPDLPAIAGREVAGVVEALGRGVEAGCLGRRVVAHLGAASAGTPSSRCARSSTCTRCRTAWPTTSRWRWIGTGRTAIAIHRHRADRGRRRRARHRRRGRPRAARHTLPARPEAVVEPKGGLTPSQPGESGVRPLIN